MIAGEVGGEIKIWHFSFLRALHQSLVSYVQFLRNNHAVSVPVALGHFESPCPLLIDIFDHLRDFHQMNWQTVQLKITWDGWMIHTKRFCLCDDLVVNEHLHTSLKAVHDVISNWPITNHQSQTANFFKPIDGSDIIPSCFIFFTHGPLGISRSESLTSVYLYAVKVFLLLFE